MFKCEVLYFNCIHIFIGMYVIPLENCIDQQTRPGFEPLAAVPGTLGGQKYRC